MQYQETNKTPNVTPTVTPKHTLLCAAIFSALMIVGSYQVITAATAPGNLDFPRTVKAFREGELTQSLEKQLDLKLPLRASAIAFSNSIRYKIFGGSGEQVRTGKDNWLFIAEELKYEGPKAHGKSGGDTEAALKTRVELIAGLSKQLQAQGVKLVVALVPDKARLYAAQLRKADYPTYNQARYQTAFDNLTQSKVTTVNLLATLAPTARDNELYYRTDTHWNQAGAQIAAREIANVVRNLKLDLPKTDYATHVAKTATERPGDLIRLMGLEFVPNILRPLPDQEHLETTTEVQAVGATKSAGLFDDATVSVALAGTSYSLRANFHGRLQEFLATKVLNTAKDGGGFLQAVTAYLKDDSFRTSKPQVLIWEIPERMLQSPITEEKGWLEKTLGAAR
jgi:alginate O-acetyltransferase complex protein AlgJ